MRNGTGVWNGVSSQYGHGLFVVATCGAGGFRPLPQESRQVSVYRTGLFEASQNSHSMATSRSSNQSVLSYLVSVIAGHATSKSSAVYYGLLDLLSTGTAVSRA